MKEECKWGKPTYTVDGKNIVIMQGFKEYFGLGFFQGALLKDPKFEFRRFGRAPPEFRRVILMPAYGWKSTGLVGNCPVAGCLNQCG